MHVFVTGGTGTIGTAVVAELLGNGHTVLALARSDSAAQTLKDAGAAVLRGGLADLDVLRSRVARFDGVISLAFGRDYSVIALLDLAAHRGRGCLRDPDRGQVRPSHRGHRWGGHLRVRRCRRDDSRQRPH